MLLYTNEDESADCYEPQVYIHMVAEFKKSNDW